MFDSLHSQLTFTVVLVVLAALQTHAPSAAFTGEATPQTKPAQLLIPKQAFVIALGTTTGRAAAYPVTAS